MTAFATLLRRADTLRRHETDPLVQEWWAGHIRGLRRAHHGESFGSPAEHELFLAAAESPDLMRAALGRGYAAGLTLTMRDPEPTAWCERCAAHTPIRHDRGDELCAVCGLA